jgi:predicted transposase/invertase (TIGR01784 family)
MLDKCCYFLRYAQNLSAVLGVLAQEVAIEHAFTIANRASLSEEESELQDRREMYIQDQRGALEKALLDGAAIGEARGEARGKAMGIEEGAYQKAIFAAKNLKAIGLNDAQIAQALGLTLAEVADLGSANS